MRRAAAVMGALALVMLSANVFAQAKPSFAGTWTLDQPEGGGGGGGGRAGGRGGGRGGGGGGFACGMTCTITQDGTTLTVNRTVGENTISAKFMLDGSDSPNSMMGRGGEATTVVSKAMWEGNNLVITTPGNNGEIKAVISMANGMMSVTTTRPGRGGGDPTTTTQNYKKN